jgi:hypothetical protein
MCSPNVAKQKAPRELEKTQFAPELIKSRANLMRAILMSKSVAVGDRRFAV